MNTKQLLLAGFSALYMSGAVSAAELWNPEQTELPAHLLKSNTLQRVDIPASAVTTSKEVKYSRLTGMPESTVTVNRQINRSNKFEYDADITGTHNFVVLLEQAPVAMYRGGVEDIAATHLNTVAKEQSSNLLSESGRSTKPMRSTLKRIQRSDEYANRVAVYQQHLKAGHQQLLNTASSMGINLSINEHYTNAVNAFTASMTQEQAAQLAKLSSIRSITPVKIVQPLGIEHAEFPSSHEVTNAKQAWDLGPGFKGENIIIGVADTGINTSSRSFAEVGDDGYVHTNPLGDGKFLGDCATDEWAHLCNNKLIGVYSYSSITDYYRTELARKVAEDRGDEYDRTYGMVRPANGIDYVGHGSHTSGIAGGNVVYDVDYLYRQYRAGPGVPGGVEKLGTVTGVAPHANIISYQVCLPGGGGDAIAGCLDDAMLKALDQAVIDGVDVLNWSIGGGSRDPWGDPILQGFLALKENGAHVTAAAGNTGGYKHVSNVTPWSLTVGATELGREQESIGSASIQFSLNGIDYDAIDLAGEKARSISGDVEGEAVLAALMGECINNDCSPALVCEADQAMIDGMCYTQCASSQERNMETLQCELKTSDNGGSDNGGSDNGSTQCKAGEKLELNECVDDHVHGNISWESLCAGGEVLLYPELQGVYGAELGSICPTISSEQCPENHQGFSGASAGTCCAYGVTDDEELVNKLIWPEEPYNINDSWHGACHGPVGQASTGNSISLIEKALKPVFNSAPAVIQAVAFTPVERVFAGDPHCLDYDSWKDPLDPTQEFDFTGKVLICARGNEETEGNIARLLKAENAAHKGAAGMVMYNDDREYRRNERLALAINVKFVDEETEDVSYQVFPYIHVGNGTWQPGTGRATLRQKLNENSQLFLKFTSVKQKVDFDPKQIKDLAGFSSKGPNKYYPSLMGPTIAAPGVNIYAPFTNDGAFQNRSNSADYAFDTGTSMAAPHMAGVMAIMKQARGDQWTAAERESAVVLSAGNVTGGSWTRIECSGLNIVNGEDLTDYENGSDAELCPEYEEDDITHQKFIYEDRIFDEETGEWAKDDEDNFIMVTKFSYFKREHTKSWQAGAGLVNVTAAINSGLVMDIESSDYLKADPKKGGDLRTLNLPYLYDDECPGTCYLTRYFTSTVDGVNTWNIDLVEDETSINIEANKQSITLSKGETAEVLFTVSIDHASSAHTDGTGLVSGLVELVSQNPDVDDSRLQVAVGLTESSLPKYAAGVANSNVGQFPINNLSPFGSANELSAKVYQQGGVKYLASDAGGKLANSTGEIIEIDGNIPNTYIGQIELPTDDTPNGWDWEDAAEDDSVQLMFVDIPENTKLFAVDVLDRIKSTATEGGIPADLWLAGDLLIAVGRDVNGDGELQYASEAMCLSVSDLVNNFCMLTNPEPGRYWVYLQNVSAKASTGFYEYLKDTFQYAVSIISDEESDAFTVVAPKSYDGVTPLSLDIAYDIELNQGDAMYGLVELGSSEHNPDNLGSLPVRLNRAEDTFTVTLSGDVVTAGNYVKVTVDYAQNHTGYKRDFELEFETPEGVTFVPYSLGGDPRFVTGYSEGPNGVNLSGFQPNSYRLYPFYQMTTNVNPDVEGFENHPLAAKYSAMCRTPQIGPNFDGSSTEGKYIDLAKQNPRGATPAYGSETPEKMVSFKDIIRINTQQLFGFGSDADFNLYNGPNTYHELRVSPMGHIDSGIDYPIFGVPYSLPFMHQGFLPDIRLAPLMIGGVDKQLTVGKKAPTDQLDAFDAQGISLGAYTSHTNKNLIIEWDNAHTIKGNRYNFNGPTEHMGDSYDFQAILDLEYSYEIGSYEVIYAYDNLDMVHNEGVVGFKGMAGIRGWAGPAGGYRYNDVAYNNMQDMLHDDLVVCFDYIGDDYSKTGFTFWLKVDEDSAGKEIDVLVKTKLDRITKSVTNTITVPGTISINEINDVVINQGETLTLPVIYNDTTRTANTITATSNDLITWVDGTEPGSTLTIDASCDFSGPTSVEVMVTDMENSNDFAKTSFNVHVQEVAGFTPSESCNDDDSSLKVAESDSSSGGSMAFILLALMTLFFGRRLKVINH